MLISLFAGPTAEAPVTKHHRPKPSPATPASSERSRRGGALPLSAGGRWNCVFGLPPPLVVVALPGLLLLLLLDSLPKRGAGS
eukprot:scaffold20_cov361-Prasinococcus_capsulatus_cf.AAC.8